MSKHYLNKACGDSCCLQVRSLNVTKGSDQILQNVTLHVHCGELVALIGPNGAGKSTLIKAILGQTEYDGVISFSSPGIRHRRPPRIGYVPQSPSFDPGECMSVADLFACCMTRRPAFLGLSRSMREKVSECLDRVHGADLIDKQVGTLSGGELQRVLLEGVTDLMDMLDEIRKTYDLSILMTTHDFSILPRYADQAVLLGGTVLAQGQPEDVLSSEAFARAFHGKGGSV